MFFDTPILDSMLSISGMPSLKASLMAHTVPTFEIMQPASAGSFPLGISTPRQDSTINFSDPWGYFVFTMQMFISSPYPFASISFSSFFSW